MEKETAVQWFYKNLKNYKSLNLTDKLIQDLYKQAMQMEKEQVLGFKYLVDKHQMDALENNAIYLSAEEYYNETYGGQDE
jgi:hypothetical protein